MKWFYPMMSPALPSRVHKIVLITHGYNRIFVVNCEFYCWSWFVLTVCMSVQAWMDEFYIFSQSTINKSEIRLSLFLHHLFLNGICFPLLCVCARACVCLPACVCACVSALSGSLRETGYHCGCQKCYVSLSANWFYTRVFILKSIALGAVEGGVDNYNQTYKNTTTKQMPVCYILSIKIVFLRSFVLIFASLQLSPVINAACHYCRE